MIPYGQHEVVQEDIDAVVQVLQSDYLTQGPVVPQFEQAVAKYCFAKRGVATNSATSALHLACLALGLEKGDVLWTSPISFVASANCGLYCGAQIDFVDIDSQTYNMCPITLEQKLKEAQTSGRLPKVVIPVHLCGQSCDMEAIRDLGDRYGFKIIEDASHAIGGTYKNDPIGNCKYSDIVVFSFHPVKIITTGEGGMAVTNDAELAEHMRLLRSHGITREPKIMTKEPDGPWYYQQIALGFNYRMTDIQAALGQSQMARIDEQVARRHTIAERYTTALSASHLTTPYQIPDSYSAFHLYIVKLEQGISMEEHKQVFESMLETGIGVNLHYIPVHLQPYYQNMGFKEGDYPNAEAFYKRAMTLPLFPTLRESEQEQVLLTLAELVK